MYLQLGIVCKLYILPFHTYPPYICGFRKLKHKKVTLNSFDYLHTLHDTFSWKYFIYVKCILYIELWDENNSACSLGTSYLNFPAIMFPPSQAAPCLLHYPKTKVGITVMANEESNGGKTWWWKHFPGLPEYITP